jgi:hypothetical protein
METQKGKGLVTSRIKQWEKYLWDKGKRAWETLEVDTSMFGTNDRQQVSMCHGHMEMTLLTVSICFMVANRVAHSPRMFLSLKAIIRPTNPYGLRSTDQPTNQPTNQPSNQPTQSSGGSGSSGSGSGDDSGSGSDSGWSSGSDSGSDSGGVRKIAVVDSRKDVPGPLLPDQVLDLPSEEVDVAKMGATLEASRDVFEPHYDNLLIDYQGPGWCFGCGRDSRWWCHGCCHGHYQWNGMPDGYAFFFYSRKDILCGG